MSSASSIEQAIGILLDPGHTYELRAFGVTEPGKRYARAQTWSGYYRDFSAMARTAAGMTDKGGAEAVYFTLNPTLPELYARCADRVEIASKGGSTTDKQILRRRWIPIDVDPERPTGISSTDAQHDAAIARAKDIAKWASGIGLPPGVLADSGNGAHLLIPCDLPTDDGELVRSFLELAAAEFNGDGLKVDTSVFNAARIWKLFGTWARKGDDIAERPHRVSRVLKHVPGSARVTVADLERVLGARKAPTAPSPAPKTGSGWSVDDVTEALRQWGYSARGPEPYRNGGTIWYLDVCPWNPEHDDDDAVVTRRDDGTLGAMCQHDSCKGKGWKDLRRANDREYESAPKVREWTGPDLLTDKPRDPRLWFPARNDALVAEHILQQHATDEPVVYDQAAYWRWEAPNWTRIEGEQPGDALAATLHEWQRNARMWIEPTEKKPDGQPYILSAAQQQSIIRHCRIPAQRPDFFDGAPTGIAFRDVFVRVDGRELVTEPLTPDHRQRHAYTFGYDPAARCPDTDRALRQILAGENDADTDDRLRLLRQFWGAAVLGMGPRFMRALILQGQKGSGKSTVGELVAATMPPGSVDAIDLQDFGDEKKAIRLSNMRLNYLAEVRHERPVVNHTVIKTVIGGELVTARDVYRSAITFRPRASHLWCANRVPQLPGVDGSWWDRMMVIGIKDHRFRGSDREVQGLAHQLAARELPGIVAQAIEGARDLLECRRYAIPLSSVHALSAWTHQADAVALWLDEATMVQPGDVPAYEWPRPTEVHDHYLGWARSRHHQQMSHHELMERILSRGIAKTNSRGARIGLMLRHASDWAAGEPAEEFAPF